MEPLITVAMETGRNRNHKHQVSKVKVMSGWCPKAAGLLLVALWIPIAMATSSESPPTFLEEPQSVIVRAGSKVVLRCRATGGATLSWLQDGAVLDTDAPGVSREGDYLVIPSLRASDPSETTPGQEGVYQCVAGNDVGAVISREAKVELAYIGTFYEGFRDMFVNVTAGNVAFIPCAPPSGRPQPITSFDVNGTEIDLGYSHYLLLPSGNLQISAVRPHDNGRYRCLATNPITGDTRHALNSVHLRVVSPVTNQAPIFRWVPPSEVHVARGNNLTLECVVEGAPVPVVTWSKYGGKLPADRHRQILGNLEIRDVGRLDEGTYICSASNGVGPQKVAVTEVNVVEPPIIQETPANQEVTEGSSVTFQCQGRSEDAGRSDHTGLSTMWYHNGEELSQDGRKITITASGLTLSDVRLRQSGIYQCILHNAQGSVTMAALLNVVKATHDTIATGDRRPEGTAGQEEMMGIAPHLAHTEGRLITVLPQNQTVAEGDSARLACESSSRREPIDYTNNFLWLKNGERLEDIDVYPERPVPAIRPGRRSRRILPTGTLEIHRVQRTDAGRYMCIMWGDLSNSDSATAYLIVKQRGDLDHSTGPQSVSTTTLRPKSDSILEILEPGEVERPGRKPVQENPGKTQPHEGLEMIPPAKPRVTRLSETSVLLDWTEDNADSADHGMPITFFKVQYKEMVSDRQRRRWRTIDTDISPSQRQYEVPGLRPGSTYRFRIVAIYSNNDNLHGPNSRKLKLRSTDSPSVDPLPDAPVTGPDIVEANATQSAIRLRWQYLPAEWTPVEGFHVYYRTYGSPDSDELRLTVNGSHLRYTEISDLIPNTMYSIRMKGYNIAGESKYSNVVVSRTLGPDGDSAYPSWVPVPSSGLDITGIPDQTGADAPIIDEEGSRTRNTTSESNRLMYIILGGLLGGLVIFLLLFMAACAWRQRNNANMLNGRSKFQDPSRTIYAAESMRHKQANGNAGMFLLSRLSSAHQQHQHQQTQQQQQQEQQLNHQDHQHLQQQQHPDELEDGLYTACTLPAEPDPLLGPRYYSDQREVAGLRTSGVSDIWEVIAPPSPLSLSLSDRSGSERGEELGQYDHEQDDAPTEINDDYVPTEIHDEYVSSEFNGDYVDDGPSEFDGEYGEVPNGEEYSETNSLHSECSLPAYQPPAPPTYSSSSRQPTANHNSVPSAANHSSVTESANHRRIDRLSWEPDREHVAPQAV